MSATVFVRNLPFDVTQDALEQVFGEIGPVKKVDVIKDKGKQKSETTTRGFAFVRFAMAADAEAAIQQLHQSDFRGRRMLVEIAKEKGKNHEKKKTTPAPVEKTAEAPAETEEAQKEETPKQKPKEKTAEKKATPAVAPAPVEDVKEDEQTDVKKSKKDKKKKEKKSKETEPKEEAQQAEETPEAAQESTDGHVQSERNARRRMHREFLRQVAARKEASATAEQKTVLVFGLGRDVTQKALYKKVKKLAAVTKVELKEDAKSNRQSAVVQLEKLADVAVVVQKLDQHIFKGATLRAVPAVKTTDASGAASETAAAKSGDSHRLIVRNLSFQATDADLDKLFSAVGPISEARVVRLPVEDGAAEGAVGKSRGFGFVQFHVVDDARRAIEQLNGHKLKGREVVVDFAVSKAKYLQQQREQENAVADQDANERMEIDGDDDENKEENEEAEDEDDDDDVEHDNELEMSEDDEAEAEDDEEDDDEDEEPAQPREDSDEQRMRTLFIRNLSFQTTEESMKEFFATFGAVEYARIVVDKASGLSKGVGFVRFRQREPADVVMMRGQNDTTQNTKRKGKKPQDQFSLSAFADGDALMLDGRMLIVTRAVARDDAERLTESNSAQRKAKDKRNMYLAYEGTINVNKLSEEELSLPKMDIEKRRRAIKEKKEKLKNPLYFVSPLRLSVRNLASHVDDAQLKQLFREAAIAGMQQRKVDMRRDVKVELLPASDRVPVKVKMAKIVRDMDNVRPGKEPRSRGYGFVEFAEHVHALAALRVVNNNPEYTSYTPGKGGSAEHEKSRLIVEFALENHGKLKLREKKQNDAKKKREEEKALKEAQGDDHKNQGQKKSRGQRQREKKKEAKEQPDEKKTDAKAKATKATPPQSKAKGVVQSKPKAAGEKKRKRRDSMELEAALPVGGEQTSQLSRKQRKQAKERRAEQSFDQLVQSYKQEIFGEKRKAPASDRWFD